LQARREDFARRQGLRVFAEDAACGFVAYIDGVSLLAVFSGRRAKRDFYERHKGMEQVQARCDAAMKDCRERAARRRAIQSEARGVVVGDVLVSSWGYDQTNIDFYEVVALRGVQSALLRKIADERMEDATLGMQGTAAPTPGVFVGHPFSVRMRGDACTINGRYYARKLTPLATVDGVRLWPAQRWTAYA
jgi:hypothetical protein